MSVVGRMNNEKRNKRVQSRFLGLALATLLGSTGLLAGALVGTEAAAQECARSYTTAELSRDLGAMTTALRAKNDSDYRNVGQRLANQLAWEQWQNPHLLDPGLAKPRQALAGTIYTQKCVFRWSSHYAHTDGL